MSGSAEETGPAQEGVDVLMEDDEVMSSSMVDALSGLDFDEHGKEDRLARKVDTVVMQRCDAVLPVLERSTDCHNLMAVVRTAEAFGLQDVWIVESALEPKARNRRSCHARRKGENDDQKELWDALAKKATDWMDMRRFKTTTECLQEMKQNGYEIWVTELGQGAQRLDDPSLRVPDKLAVVFGREADGASQEMLQAADRRVYLPLAGFADSLNLSVSAACILQQIFFMRPDLRASMSEDRRAALRAQWYAKIARTPEQKQHFLEDLLPLPPRPFRDPRRPDVHRMSWVPKKVRERQAEAETKAQSSIVENAAASVEGCGGPSSS